MAINFLNNISLNKNQLEQARIENLAADPASGVAGQIYFNTVSNVLKIYNGTIWKEVGGGVITITTANSTFVNLVPTGTAEDPILTASLSATGTPSASTFLRGDNVWSTIDEYTGWTLAGNTGTPQLISSGNTASILGAGVITTAASATDTITITHSNVTRTNTSSSASPAFGATFTAVDSVTSSAQGHITALNLKTVTLPANPNTNTTYTLPVAAGGANTAVINLTQGGSGSGVASSVTFSGTTNEIEVTEIVGNNGTITIGLPNNVTVTGALTVSGATQSSFGGQVTIPMTPIANTDAASKNYVDAATVGGLIYQGGYNAATNTPDLDVAPIAGIKKGWTYTVTADGLFFTEQVRVGDVLISEINSPTTLANWTTVQNNVDLASLAQIGIGNVNKATDATLKGINVEYNSGTAKVGLDFQDLPVFTTVDAPNSWFAYYDLFAGSNKRITATNLSKELNQVVSGIGWITAGQTVGTVAHTFGTVNTIVQTIDSTGATVFCDITRTANTVTATIATAQANTITILVQKIG